MCCNLFRGGRHPPFNLAPATPTLAEGSGFKKSENAALRRTRTHRPLVTALARPYFATPASSVLKVSCRSGRTRSTFRPLARRTPMHRQLRAKPRKTGAKENGDNCLNANGAPARLGVLIELCGCYRGLCRGRYYEKKSQAHQVQIFIEARAHQVQIFIEARAY
jgi:hypothetical protein